VTDQPPEITTIRVGDELGRGGLYNMVVPGGFERAHLLLPVIGLNPDAGNVIRLRDAWVETDPEHGIVIHVYTRIGGGNRADYADAIQTLRETPGYLRDADDGFDATYASFWFTVPEGSSAALTDFAIEPVDTGARWKQLLEMFHDAAAKEAQT